eukprot:3407129-Rhodomonas_salina.1
MLPDVNIYPLPAGGAPEPIWVPVWQRLCVWAECGYIAAHSRTVAERAYFADLPSVLGSPTIVTFTTQSLLLQVNGPAVVDTQVACLSYLPPRLLGCAGSAM